MGHVLHLAYPCGVSTTILGQLVAVSGLVGAIGAYAGILRRRRASRNADRITDEATSSAIDRVARLRALDRVAD
jgi:hypothetical protein